MLDAASIDHGRWSLFFEQRARLSSRRCSYDDAGRVAFDPTFVNTSRYSHSLDDSAEPANDLAIASGGASDATEGTGG